MKQNLWAGAVLGVALFAARAGHATEGWVQLPGAATQIAVGANDIPFIVDTNGYAQYLAPAQISCGRGICVPAPREWQPTNIRPSVIACDQYGYLWATDALGQLSLMSDNLTAFDTRMFPTGIAATLSSIAPGRMLPAHSEWNVPFGVASTAAPSVPFGTDINMPFTTTYVTGAASPGLFSVDLTAHAYPVYIGNGNWSWQYPFTSNGWQQLDTGELQVTQFTIDGSANQVPWIIVVGSDGNRVPFSIPSVSDTWRYIGNPKPRGLVWETDWITDHFIAAHRGSSSAVWYWTGNAYGTTGAWAKYENSDVLPHGGKIAQIAYAAALPGTRIGTIGPSQLYMIDSYHNIYQWGTVMDVPK